MKFVPIPIVAFFLLLTAPSIFGSTIPFCEDAQFVSNTYPLDMNHNQFSPGLADDAILWVENINPTSFENKKGRIFARFFGNDSTFGTADDFEMEFTQYASPEVSVNGLKASNENVVLEIIDWDQNNFSMVLCGLRDINCLNGSEKVLDTVPLASSFQGYDIFDKKVVWSNGGIVYLYDILADKISSISANSGGGFPINPKIGRFMVVWEDLSGSSQGLNAYRIFGYNLLNKKTSIIYQSLSIGHPFRLQDVGNFSSNTSLTMGRKNDSNGFFYEDNPSVIATSARNVSSEPLNFWTDGSYYDYAMDDVFPRGYFEFDTNHEYTYYKHDLGGFVGVGLGKQIMGFDFPSRTPFVVADTNWTLYDVVGAGGEVAFVEHQYPDQNDYEFQTARVKYTKCS